MGEGERGKNWDDEISWCPEFDWLAEERKGGAFHNRAKYCGFHEGFNNIFAILRTRGLKERQKSKSKGCSR